MTDRIDLNVLHTGVPGLDTLLGGGLPELSFNIIAGETGCGKTTLSTAFLAEGVAQGESGIIATFEKSPQPLLNDKLDAMAHNDAIHLLNMRALDLSMDGTLHELILIIDQFEVKRVVLDSLAAFNWRWLRNFAKIFAKRNIG